MNESQKLGIHGEQLATQYLKKLGHQIIEKNYRCALGEIDIVSTHQEYLIFSEVKTRQGTTNIHPSQAVGWKKQKKLQQLGQYYLQEKKIQNKQPRFDVIAVQIIANQKKPIIEHFINAF